MVKKEKKNIKKKNVKLNFFIDYIYVHTDNVMRFVYKYKKNKYTKDMG